MAAPMISELPDAPTPADAANPKIFNSKAFTFVAAQPVLVTEINALVTWLNSNIDAKEVSEKSGTAFSLTVEDSGAYIRTTNAAAKVLTVQLESTTPFPEGATFFIKNTGAGVLTITPVDGVIVNDNLALNEGASAILQKIDENIYDLITIGGDFVTDLTALSALVDTKSPTASPAFTGNPTAPTPTTGDNDTSIATTAFVQASKPFANGTEAAPSITFTSDPDTGIYRKGANSIGFVTNATDVAVLTSAGRYGVGLDSPLAKIHASVDNDVTCGIRSTCSWTGSTATPYQNNDNTLFETHNEILSNSTNYSWSVSADNGSNNIPAGVTDLGFRKGVYGWAVSKDTASATHDGTLALQIGVHGLAGFLGAGNAGIGTVLESIGLRGEINNDAVGATIQAATAVEAISVSTLGDVVVNYAVRAIALNGTTENWSFHGDGGQLFNQDKALFESKFTEMDSSICSRGVGNIFEFGFPSSGGYGSSIGVMPSSGDPFIALGAKVDAATDTFTTTGQLGFVISNNLGADSLIFSRLVNTSGSGLSPSEVMRIDENGRVQLQGTPILPAFAPASASDAGQTGQVGWDANYIYICVATNTWTRAAIAAW